MFKLYSNIKPLINEDALYNSLPNINDNSFRININKDFDRERLIRKVKPFVSSKDQSKLFISQFFHENTHSKSVLVLGFSPYLVSNVYDSINKKHVGNKMITCVIDEIKDIKDYIRIQKLFINSTRSIFTNILYCDNYTDIIYDVIIINIYILEDSYDKNDIDEKLIVENKKDNEYIDTSMFIFIFNKVKNNCNKIILLNLDSLDILRYLNNNKLININKILKKKKSKYEFFYFVDLSIVKNNEEYRQFNFDAYENIKNTYTN